MHPDISYEIMLDRVATLREEAANCRRARRVRRHQRNPIRRIFGNS
jgi:hypothetical protein